MRRLWLATVALIGLSGGWAIADYTGTQGVGTTFGSVVVGGVHYVQNFLCDLTVPARCVTVSAAGAVKVDGSAVTQPVSLTSTTITGTAAVTQSGPWTVQPGNTANTTAWLMNVGLINGVTPLMGNGVTGTGSQRVTISSDNTAFSVNLGTIGGAATAANQATANTSLASIDTKVGSPVPLGGASGGMTPLKLAALTNTAVVIKASAGQLYKLYCYNPNATVAYIQVYNVAAAGVTVGTTAALQSYGIPATSSSGFTDSLVGDQYGTAISAAATTTAGGGTAPGTAVDCNVSFN